MRHARKNKSLGRTKAPRKALIRNLASSLVLYEKIETTLSKAKVLRPYVEKIITLAKEDSVHNRRLATKKIFSKGALKKLFEVLGPRFKNRNGGYTRIIKLGSRVGDNAPMAVIEFVEGNKKESSTEVAGEKNKKPENKKAK